MGIFCIKGMLIHVFAWSIIFNFLYFSLEAIYLAISKEHFFRKKSQQFTDTKDE